MESNLMSNITPNIKTEMENIWFTADLHHGHPKIVNICNRPIHIHSEEIIQDINNPIYCDALNVAHNEWLMNDVINKYVKKKDFLYILGDVSLAKKYDAEKFIDGLNGNKFLIKGNHDENIKNSTRFSQITQIKDFNFSKNNLNIHIVLCHYPIDSWNRKVHNAWHLYGHVHGRLNKQNSLSFDVGIDNPELHKITGGVYRPLNLFEIINLMERKKTFIDEEKIKFEHGIH